MGRYSDFKQDQVLDLVATDVPGAMDRAGAVLLRIRTGMDALSVPAADLAEVEARLARIADRFRDGAPPGWRSWTAWARWRINGLLDTVDRWRGRTLAAEAERDKLAADYHRRGVKIIELTEYGGAHLCRAEAAEAKLAGLMNAIKKARGRWYHRSEVAEHQVRKGRAPTRNGVMMRHADEVVIELNGLLTIAALDQPTPSVEGVDQDAARFRALLRCGRIKMQGSIGVDPHTGERNGNNVHFGAEFWPEPPEPESEEHYRKGTIWGRACIKALADAILEREAAAGLPTVANDDLGPSAPWCAFINPEGYKPDASIVADELNPNNRRVHFRGAQLCKVYGFTPEEAQAKAEMIAAALESWPAKP